MSQYIFGHNRHNFHIHNKSCVFKVTFSAKCRSVQGSVTLTLFRHKSNCYIQRNCAKNGLYGNLMGLGYQDNLKKIHFNIIIKNMRRFLGSVGVRGYVRGLFFTIHQTLA